MKKFIKTASVLLLLVMLIAALPATVFATADTTPGESSVSISSLYMLGSNQKYYNPSPSLTAGVNSYSFNVPDWMPSVTICIKSVSGLSVTADNATFTSNGSTYRGEITLDSDKKTVAVSMTGTAGTRSLSITVRKISIETFFDTVTMMDGDKTVEAQGTIADGLTYTLNSGVTERVLRIMPRHENEVFIENLTNDSTGNPVAGTEPKQKLELTNSRYETTLKLIEGTNKFTITISAGTVTKTCEITVIVGNANANEVIVTTTTTAPVISDSDDTGALVTTAPTAPTATAGGGLSPIMWVAIGIIIAVVIGACIFMIVNMSSGNSRDHIPPIDEPPLYRPQRGRNLGDFADDDYYDDGYGAPRGIGNRGYRDDGYRDDGYGRPGGYQGGGRGGYPNGGYGGYDNYSDDDDGYGGYRGY